MADYMDKQKAAELLDNLIGMVEDSQENDYDTALKMGIKALKADVQPVQRWIPCSERLPEKDGEYICTMQDGQVQECGFVPTAQKGLIPGWSTCEADGYKFLRHEDVIAWMPLPEPYEEESENKK